MKSRDRVRDLYTLGRAVSRWQRDVNIQDGGIEGEERVLHLENERKQGFPRLFYDNLVVF